MQIRCICIDITRFFQCVLLYFIADPNENKSKLKKKKKKNKHKHKHKSEKKEREESRHSSGHVVHTGMPIVDTMPELSEPSSPEIDDF